MGKKKGGGEGVKPRWPKFFLDDFASPVISGMELTRKLLNHKL